MKKHITLDFVERSTYRSAYRHLDMPQLVSYARMTKPNMVECTDDGSAEFQFVVVLSPTDMREARDAHKQARTGDTFEEFMIRAIEQQFDYSCACEHDCCACQQSYATATRVKPREWSVTQRTYLNI